MNNSSQNNKGWNEFRWEKEIRQDEKRIRGYFRILPSCLDLPDEEDSIISKLLAQPDLVPSKVSKDKNNGSLDIFFEDEDDHLDITDLKDRNDSDIFMNLHKLSIKWNILMVHDLRRSLRKQAMTTACIFGTATARSIDVIELEEANIPQFKISLLKRILHDINSLLGHMNSYIRQQHSLKAQIDIFIQHLHSVREKVISVVHETRKNMK